MNLPSFVCCFGLAFLTLSCRSLPTTEGANAKLSGLNPNRYSYQTDTLSDGLKGVSPTFKRIVYFSDSLTDEGWAHRTTRGVIPNPSYYRGRFSNGPVWPEYIRGGLHIEDLNLSTGGAASSNENSYVRLRNIVGFPKSVQQSIKDHIKAKDFTPAGTLYVIWVGANDFFANVKNVSGVALNIKESAELLIENGAKIIMIPDLLPLNKLPHNVPKIRLPPVDFLEEVTKQFNIAVRNHCDELRAKFPGVKIVNANPGEILSSIQDEKKYISFDNVKDACFVGNAVLGSGGDHNILCENSDRYLFWDRYHPSTRAHCAMAGFFIDVIHKSGLLTGRLNFKELMDACDKQRANESVE